MLRKRRNKKKEREKKAQEEKKRQNDEKNDDGARESSYIKTGIHKDRKQLFVSVCFTKNSNLLHFTILALITSNNRHQK